MFSSLHRFRFRNQKKLVASTRSHVTWYFEGSKLASIFDEKNHCRFSKITCDKNFVTCDFQNQHFSSKQLNKKLLIFGIWHYIQRNFLVSFILTQLDTHSISFEENRAFFGLAEALKSEIFIWK